MVRVDLEDVKLSNRHIKFKYRIYNETEKKEAAICEIMIASTNVEIDESVPIPDEIVKRFKSAMSNK
jgi:acyl-CoA thioesterase FadM